MTESDHKLDSFIITRLDREHGTKLLYDEERRLTVTSEVWGRCKTEGCHGTFFMKLGAFYTKAACGHLSCESCRMGVGPYKIPGATYES